MVFDGEALHQCQIYIYSAHVHTHYTQVEARALTLPLTRDLNSSPPSLVLIKTVAMCSE